MSNLKLTYVFSVCTYTNEFDYIVKTHKLIKVKRASIYSAIDFMYKKYPRREGYFFEASHYELNGKKY